MTAQERGDAAVWPEEVGTYWRRRHILLLLAAANIVFTGAPVLGWSGMQAILDRERRYSSMCRGAGDSGDEVPTHCDSRAVYVNLVYTVATFAFMSASLPLGFVADKLGPRRTAAACNIAAGVGALMVATPTRWGMPIDTFFAGLPVAAFFGPGLQVAFATVANLFPGSEGTVIGVMSGMMGGSAIMFPVYNAVHAAAPSVSLSALFTAHAAMCGLFACLSRLFPLRAVSEAAAAQEAEVEIIKPTDGPRDNETCGGEVPDRSGNGGIATLPTASDRGTAAQRGAPVAGADPEGAVEGLVSVKEVSRQAPLSLLALACSRPVLALLLLYTVHYLRLAFYLGTASLQLLRLAGGDEGVASTYLTLLGWIAPFGCLAAPVIGRIDDARGHRFAMALVHVMGLVHCVVTLVPFLPVQAVGMMLYTAQQEMLFAVGLARVLKLVPTHQFGVASGAFLLLGALVSLLVAPLTALAVSVFDGNFTVVNAALLAVTVAATPALRGLDRRRDVGRSLPRQE